MEDKVMGIAELRRSIGDAVEAAHFRKEVTFIEHGKRHERRAAIVPAEWVDELRKLRAKVAELTAGQE